MHSAINHLHTRKTVFLDYEEQILDVFFDIKNNIELFIIKNVKIQKCKHPELKITSLFQQKCLLKPQSYFGLHIKLFCSRKQL